ncbi:hypothetical protein Acor_65820 [Acrocarpospora corrugata]|uniref:Mutator family transposase n=1 Tax=Acrocarpospora corrugata TaxID=35763 RepID=A0A5M3W6S8_9ACTN|nr:hypothetical protein Acor_65820 [Acrocarpospora corrugata]
MCIALFRVDAQVEEFRTRALAGGPYTFLWLDVLTQKVREGGRIVNVHCLVATAVNANGQRKILSLEVSPREDGAGWPSCARWWPAACPASNWSPPMPTRVWWTRSAPACRAPPGSAAAPTTCAIC